VKLEEKEVDFDDDNDSAFIKLERYLLLQLCKRLGGVWVTVVSSLCCSLATVLSLYMFLSQNLSQSNYLIGITFLNAWK
jgi:hypothetical protein